MSQCPVCKMALTREAYDEAPVWRCPQCHGVLLTSAKLERIHHVRQKSGDELKAEAQREIGADTTDKIKCPECLSRMEKRPLARKYSDLTMDVCRRCDAIWLDGGELALAQLVFQASTRGRESLEFQERMQQLESDPERKARFEEAMSKLRESLPDDRNDMWVRWLESVLLRQAGGLFFPRL